MSDIRVYIAIVTVSAFGRFIAGWSRLVLKVNCLLLLLRENDFFCVFINADFLKWGAK
jgi:hypothetical protein